MLKLKVSAPAPSVALRYSATNAATVDFATCGYVDRCFSMSFSVAVIGRAGTAIADAAAMTAQQCLAGPAPMQFVLVVASDPIVAMPGFCCGVASMAV